MHSRSGSSDEAAANSVMTQLSDLLASDVPIDTAAGKMQSNASIFWEM